MYLGSWRHSGAQVVRRSRIQDVRVVANELGIVSLGGCSSAESGIAPLADHIFRIEEGLHYSGRALPPANASIVDMCGEGTSIRTRSVEVDAFVLVLRNLNDCFGLVAFSLHGLVD